MLTTAMNPFPAYLHEQLEEKLKERRVVVWYDPNREFAPFVEALVGEMDDQGVQVADPATRAHHGSLGNDCTPICRVCWREGTTVSGVRI